MFNNNSRDGVIRVTMKILVFHFLKNFSFGKKFLRNPATTPSPYRARVAAPWFSMSVQVWVLKTYARNTQTKKM